MFEDLKREKEQARKASENALKSEEIRKRNVAALIKRAEESILRAQQVLAEEGIQLYEGYSYSNRPVGSIYLQRLKPYRTYVIRYQTEADGEGETIFEEDGLHRDGYFLEGNFSEAGIKIGHYYKSKKKSIPILVIYSGAYSLIKVEEHTPVDHLLNSILSMGRRGAVTREFQLPLPGIIASLEQYDWFPFTRNVGCLLIILLVLILAQSMG